MNLTHLHDSLLYIVDVLVYHEREFYLAFRSVINQDVLFECTILLKQTLACYAMDCSLAGALSYTVNGEEMILQHMFLLESFVAALLWCGLPWVYSGQTLLSYSYSHSIMFGFVPAQFVYSQL